MARPMSHARTRPVWVLGALAAFSLLVFLLDVVVSPSISLVPLLAVPVVVSALFLGFRATLALAVFVLLLAVASSIENGIIGQPGTLVQLASLVVVCVLAAVTARVREELEGRRREALGALQESELRYRLLAENSSDVVYEVGPDRRVTWISSNVSEALGWSVSELLGTSMYDLIHPEDRARIDALREAVFAGQDIPNPKEGWASRWRHKDGTYTWMSLRTTTIRDADGAMASAVTGMRDVDALVREREVAEIEAARRAAILQTLLDPHVLLQAVRDERRRVVDFVYIDANEAACVYNRRSRDELIGARLLDVLPGHAGTGPLLMYAHTVESGEPLALDDFPYVNEILGEERRYDMRVVRLGDSVSVTWRDVTERYEAVKRIAESEEHFRLLADNSSDVVLRLRNDIIEWASPSLTETLGWLPDEWTDHAVEEFIHPDDLSVIDDVRARVEAGDPWVTTMRIRAKDGSHHWVEVHAGAFITPEGQHEGTVASFRVVDVEVEAQQALSRRATYDDLTGALKRDPALEQLQTIGHQPRKPGSETGVLFMDIDDFKSVNDTLGHAAGDTLLKAITQRIRESIRTDDTVARMGGDEFLVTLFGLHDLDEAVDVAEKLRQACSQPIATDQGPVTVTVSIGVTLADPVETGDQIVARADQAMYRAKRAGRNTVAAIPIGAPGTRAGSIIG